MSRRLRAPASCAYSRLSSISRVRSLRTPRSARCSPIARSSAAQGSRLASWRNTVFWCGMAWLLLMSDASGNASDQVESRPRSLYSKNEPDRRASIPDLMTRPELMEEVFIRAPALRSLEGKVLAEDPRLAIGIYRAAVATAAMDFVRFKRK